MNWHDITFIQKKEHSWGAKYALKLGLAACCKHIGDV